MGKILVVDDEAANLRLMSALLVPLGHEVVLANGGAECLRLVSEESPDLILLDVMMPGMDGFEVARRLTADEKTRSVPIVMVTALHEVQYRVRALEAGACDFLTKPVEKTELRARVNSLIKVKAYHDELCAQNTLLEGKVRRRTAQLEEAYRQLKSASIETIYRLVRAAEYKDEDTGNHVRRMSRYSATIAGAYGMDAESRENILYAAPMHDIGKIGIPEKILAKPGKLTAEEWEEMKQHTVIGACILEDSEIPFVDLGRVIALTHHEKWDGGGYPQGLCGEDIPLAGRIVAVADVFDALSTRRPYKEAFPLDRVLKILREGAGRDFDPAVVRAFEICLEEILSIRSKLMGFA